MAEEGDADSENGYNPADSQKREHTPLASIPTGGPGTIGQGTRRRYHTDARGSGRGVYSQPDWQRLLYPSHGDDASGWAGHTIIGVPAVSPSMAAQHADEERHHHQHDTDDDGRVVERVFPTRRPPEVKATDDESAPLPSKIYYHHALYPATAPHPSSSPDDARVREQRQPSAVTELQAGITGSITSQRLAAAMCRPFCAISTSRDSMGR